ncbi:very short patch repair endonuclease [Salmonirosea aquatica]|uniref:DNA mismatch endonuclease Vsr n=1 Tax=Salmonirosea aquatica TaxID=2654236 RepID=A0A7C9BCX4_9BACT|nr:DNA mismatch endonuclease Vsr [Cytophagaceae bacterium SJW1-29]
MADIFDKAKRRKIMQAIRGKDTRPEWLVRKCLHRHGFRYRLHDRRLPGRPDLVLRKYNTVILVQGCFWHGHEPCRIGRLPKSNRTWWEEKINRNRARDQRNLFLLEKLGWNIWTIYECELRTATDRAQTLGRLLCYLHGRQKVEYTLASETAERYEVVEEELIFYTSNPKG